MANLSKDVFRGFKFSVKILSGEDFFEGRAAFQKVSGLKKSIEVVEYREGNMPDRMEKLAGMVSFDSVTLERGISSDDAFNSWMKAVGDVVTNTNSEMPNSGNNDVGTGSFRCDVEILLFNKQAQPVKKYILKGAWASEYTIGDFDATSNDVVITSLVLQHHGILETNLV